MRKKLVNFSSFVVLILCATNVNLCAQSLDSRLCEKEKHVLNANLKKELKSQEMDLKLITKYGLNLSQLQQYKAIRETSRSRIKQIKDSSLSRADKYSKIKVIRDHTLNDIQKILSSEQWSRFTSERLKDRERDNKIQEIIKRYKKELRLLSQQSSNTSKKSTRNKLRGKCKLELLGYMDKKQANKMMRKINIERISKSKEFKVLSLNNSEKGNLAYFKLRHQRQIKKLKSEKLPLRVTRNKRKSIDDIYSHEIKGKLGNERFSRWRKFHDTAFERRCKEEFGFTKLQISQYKYIKNKIALARFKINHSKLTNEQKNTKKEELLSQENNDIKRILTQEQYRKYEEFKNLTKKNLGHIKPAI